MATGRALFQAHVDGAQAESIPLVVSWILSTADFAWTTLSWGPGDTTLVVPATATFLVIKPPSTNLATLTLKGNAADVGWQILPTLPTVVPVHGAGVPRILTASLAVAGLQVAYL